MDKCVRIDFRYGPSKSGSKAASSRISSHESTVCIDVWGRCKCSSRVINVHDPGRCMILTVRTGLRGLMRVEGHLEYRSTRSGFQHSFTFSPTTQRELLMCRKERFFVIAFQPSEKGTFGGCSCCKNYLKRRYLRNQSIFSMH